MPKLDAIRLAARALLPQLLERACDAEDDFDKAMAVAVNQAVRCALLMETQIKDQVLSGKKKASDNGNTESSRKAYPIGPHKPGL